MEGRMKRARPNPFPGQYPLASILALGLVVSACGEKKQDPAPEPAPAAEPTPITKPTPPAKKPAEPPAIPADDPLLGTWEVVDDTGKHAEVNVGLVYTFGADGKAIVRGIRTNPHIRARDMKAFNDPTKEGVIVENEWAWLRVAPDEIAMTHSDSPLSASITTKFEGDELKFTWNKKGSVFTMKRMKD
jgi:hypothetical protein